LNRVAIVRCFAATATRRAKAPAVVAAQAHRAAAAGTKPDRFQPFNRFPIFELVWQLMQDFRVSHSVLRFQCSTPNSKIAILHRQFSAQLSILKGQPTQKWLPFLLFTSQWHPTALSNCADKSPALPKHRLAFVRPGL
jgi:hypothetical protein